MSRPIILSDEQRLAVEYQGGPQIVLAGPGSGKTLVIVEKAAYLVEKGSLKASEILVLTYTENTAFELNKRLRHREKDRPLPEASTFHGFCYRVVSEHYHLLGYRQPPSVLGDFARYQLQRKAYFAAAEVPPGVHAPDEVIVQLDEFVSRAADELVTPEALAEYLVRKRAELGAVDSADLRATMTSDLDDLQLAGHFYENYMRLKFDEGGIDFGDMILGAHKLFTTRPEILALWRRRIKYILVDEFQDANSAQVELVVLLAKPSGNICIVGDDDQSIYRFRGASYGTFENFLRYFPEAVIHQLTVNYRSTPEIVAASKKLISHKRQKRFRGEKPLRSGHPSCEKIGVFISEDTIVEAEKVADLVEYLLGNGDEDAEFKVAVISRNHDHREQIRRSLEKRKIRYVDQQPLSIFSDFDVHVVVSFLRGALADDEQDWVYPLLMRFCPDLSPSSYSELAASLTVVPAFEAVCQLASSPMVSIVARAGLEFCRDLLAELRRSYIGMSPSSLVETIMAKTGLLTREMMTEVKATLKVRALAGLWAAACSFEEEMGSDLRLFLDYLKWAEATAAIRIEQKETAAVQLLSVHSAKGMEFPVVIMVGLSEVKFPTRDRRRRFQLPAGLSRELPPPDDAHIQEERRLFYVGMTRAAKRLFLSGIERSRVQLSRFCSEVITADEFHTYGQSIDPAALLATRTKQHAKNVGQSAGLIGVEVDPYLHRRLVLLVDEWWRSLAKSGQQVDPGVFKRWISQMVEACELRDVTTAVTGPIGKVRLSYSDIRDYTICPALYRFKCVLKIPERLKPTVFLGDAIHRTLHEVMDTACGADLPDLADITRSFQQKWETYRYPDRDWMQALGKMGEQMILNFYLREAKRQTKVHELEKRFEVEYDDFVLTGRVDRIDRDEKGGYHIIDYKTGRRSAETSRNSEQKDQLIIYAAAGMHLYGQLPASVSLYYLVDDYEESSIVSERQVAAMEQEMATIAQRIAAGDFDATPSSFECSRCSYRAICPFKAA